MTINETPGTNVSLESSLGAEPTKLGDGVVITGLTGAAYMAAFAYEAGWASALGYPLELINLQLLPTLFAALLSLLVLTMFWNFGGLIYAVARPDPNDHPLARVLRPYLLMALIWFAFVLVNDFAVGRVLVLLGYLLLLHLAFTLVFPLIAFRNVRGYFAKLEASRLAEQPAGGFSRFQARVRGLEGGFIAASIVVALSFTAGHAGASRTKLFFIVGESPEWVVLRVYGSHAITAELVRKEQGFRPRYRVVDLGEHQGVLTREELGALNPLPKAPVPPSIGPRQ